MKALILSLISLVFCFQAQAWDGYLICENGSFSQMGDSYFRIHLYEDGVEFFRYESSFSFDAGEFIYGDGNTLSVLDKKVSIFSEGEEWVESISFMITLSSDETKLYLAMSDYADGPFFTEEFFCKEESY